MGGTERGGAQRGGGQEGAQRGRARGGTEREGTESVAVIIHNGDGVNVECSDQCACQQAFSAINVS